MAKGRMLLKSVSISQKLAGLPSDSDRLLWTWLLAHLDREGRFYAEPSVVKGHAVPRLKNHTEETITESLERLAAVGLIVLYEVNGDRYLQYTQFDEHQAGLHKDREAPSPCPPPPVKVRRKSGKGPAKVPLNIREGNIREDNIKVLESWNSLNIRNLKDGESKVRDKAEAKIEAVLKDYPLDVVIKAIENYGQVIHHPESFFFSYQWELVEFLQRGLRKFMDEGKPFENFKGKGGEHKPDEGLPPRDSWKAGYEKRKAQEAQS
ncbi:MAG: hypothetical protein IMZ71_01175 [Chloroflexi bacterium]|nr:hypothetical protein [Chloroflexota bacterium]